MTGMPKRDRSRRTDVPSKPRRTTITIDTEHMSRRTTTTPTDESIDDRQHAAPERNRYFHGKLMTARDMAAEQRYHRGLFTRHARSVTGYGVVEGLDASVEHVDGGLAVSLSPGYAIDCAGRPVVVPSETTVEIPNEEIPSGDRLELRLVYDECVTETVPIPGSEDACERECAYNRIVETFDLEIDRYDPTERPVKPVPPVDLPRGGTAEPPVGDDLVTELREELREAIREEAEAATEARMAEQAARETRSREAEESARESRTEAADEFGTLTSARLTSGELQAPRTELLEAVDLEQRRSRFLLQSSPEPTPTADALLEPELAVVSRRREVALEAGETERAERLLQLANDIEAGRTSLVAATRIDDAIETEADAVEIDDAEASETEDPSDGDGTGGVRRSAADPHRIARSWDGVGNRPVGCGTEVAGTVPLGAFDRPVDGNVTVDPASRPRVYTNDMLYSGLAHHVTDFGNPHGVVASLNGLTGGVELDSADGSVEFGVDPGAGTVDLSVVHADDGGEEDGSGGDEILRVQAMAVGADAFAGVADDFDVDVADDLADVLREAVQADEIARHPDRYLEFIDGAGGSDVLERHHAVGDAIAEHVGGRGRYEHAVSVLAGSVDEGDPRRVAIAQLLVADAARRLTGQTVDLTRFFPNPDPARPLTIDGVIFDAPEGFQLLHEEWYEILEEAETEAERMTDEADDDDGGAETFRPVLRGGHIDLERSLQGLKSFSTAVESKESTEKRPESTEDRAEPEGTLRALKTDVTAVESAKSSRTAFFGPAVIEAPELGKDIVDVIDDITVPIRRTPRAYLDFSELYVDVPETGYVEGDLGVGKYPVEVLALDREGSPVDEDEVGTGRGTFTVSGDGIDRLRLSVRQGTGELTELRIR